MKVCSINHDFVKYIYEEVILIDDWHSDFD
jgi:hypothetical protein